MPDSTPRILVAEDEPMIVMLIETILQSAGFSIVGPAVTAARGIELLRQEAPHAALLDITLRGGPVFPLADALLRQRVPFLFLSGHSASMLPPHHRHRTLLPKPFRKDALLQNLRKLLAAAPGTPA